MSIPNLLSLLWLVLVPVFAVVFFQPAPDAHRWAVLIYLTAFLTDVADGWIARHFNQITKLGRNGMFVYESVPGTAAYHLNATDTGISFSVEGPEDAQITLELEEETEYEITVDGASAGKMKTNLGGKLTVSVELGEKPVEVQIQKC